MIRDIDPDPWRSAIWRRRLAGASAGLWAATALAFAATLVTIHAIIVVDYGKLVLVTSIVGGISVFLDVSLEDAVVHFGTMRDQAHDPRATRNLVRLSLKVDVVVGVIVFLAIIVLAEPISRGIGLADGALLIRLAALEPLARTVDPTTGAVLLLRSKPVMRAWVECIGSLMRLVGVAIAASSHRLAPILIAFAAAALAGAVVQAFVAYRAFGHPTLPIGEERPATMRVRTLLGFSAHASLATTVRAVKGSVIALILGRGLGTPSIGIIDVATFPTSLAAVATSPLRLVTVHEQTELVATGSDERLRRYLRWLSVVGFLVGTAAAVIGWFTLPYLLPKLFGADYRSAVGPARALLPAAVAGLTVPWAKTLPVAVGRPQVRSFIAFIDLVVSTVALLVLARHGITAAAAAFSIAAWVVTISWIVEARRALRGIKAAPADADDAVLLE
jgi:O-antigen/teichoic acid export membrane protein